VIVERDRHTKELAGGVGSLASAGGQRRDLEVIRERLQSRDVRLGRPSPIRIGADYADTNPLVSILAYCGHTLSFERALYEEAESRRLGCPARSIETDVILPATGPSCYKPSSKGGLSG